MFLLIMIIKKKLRILLEKDKRDGIVATRNFFLGRINIEKGASSNFSLLMSFS